MVKLSKRLSAIAHLTSHHYDHIWDCCCDHGYLGMALLQRYPNTQIHFVDIVADLIQSVEEKLRCFAANDTQRWHCYCADASQLPLRKYSGRHLIIIAGIGGNLMCQMLEKLFEQCDLSNTDWLLCPVNQVADVRDTLMAHQCALLDEHLLEDKQRFYEIIKSGHLHAYPNRPLINPIGEKIWQVNDDEQRRLANRYLAKLLNHYEKLANKDDPRIHTRRLAYQNVTLTMPS